MDVAEAAFRQTGLSNGIQKRPQPPPGWLGTGPSGDPPENMGYWLPGTVTKKGRIPYAALPAHLPSLKAPSTHPLPPGRQPHLCCPACHSPALSSTKFSLLVRPPMSPFTANPTCCHPLVTPPLGPPSDWETPQVSMQEWKSVIWVMIMIIILEVYPSILFRQIRDIENLQKNNEKARTITTQILFHEFCQ